jgi:hypothetical protein
MPKFRISYEIECEAANAAEALEGFLSSGHVHEEEWTVTRVHPRPSSVIVTARNPRKIRRDGATR